LPAVETLTLSGEVLEIAIVEEKEAHAHHTDGVYRDRDLIISRRDNVLRGVGTHKRDGLAVK
jgi:hypothetical protein